MIVGTVSDDKMLLREALSLAVTVVAPRRKIPARGELLVQLGREGSNTGAGVGAGVGGSGFPCGPPPVRPPMSQLVLQPPKPTVP